ncbi:hypothetical protein HRbin36_02667 [bacterium HR36]|nr:hypothetical protein HRbin36_02667 [bacterium HR36]
MPRRFAKQKILREQVVHSPILRNSLPGEVLLSAINMTPPETFPYFPNLQLNLGRVASAAISRAAASVHSVKGCGAWTNVITQLGICSCHPIQSEVPAALRACVISALPIAGLA